MCLGLGMHKIQETEALLLLKEKLGKFWFLIPPNDSLVRFLHLHLHRPVDRRTVKSVINHIIDQQFGRCTFQWHVTFNNMIQLFTIRSRFLLPAS